VDRYAMIALGGALGAIARYQVTAGAYTTFSAVEFETFQAFTQGAVLIGAANAIGSIVAGYAALWLGVVLPRSF